MSWSHAASIWLAIFILGGFGWLLRPHLRGASRRRDVLPPPSAACKRNTVESVP